MPLHPPAFNHLGAFLSAFHPRGSHPSIFLHPFRWFRCASLCIEVLFIHPSIGLYTTSRFFSSIHRWGSTLHSGAFHPSIHRLLRYIWVLFIHPCIEFCVTSRFFSSIHPSSSVLHPSSSIHSSCGVQSGFALNPCFSSIHPSIMEPGQFFSDVSRWFSACFSSRNLSNVLSDNPSLLFIHPSILFVAEPLSAGRVQALRRGTLVSRQRYIQVLFIHPSIEFCVTSILFSSIQVVGGIGFCVKSFLFIHPSTMECGQFSSDVSRWFSACFSSRNPSNFLCDHPSLRFIYPCIMECRQIFFSLSCG